MVRRQKSIQSSKLQQNKFSEWIEEDKKLLNNSVSVSDISKFLCGNFELIEIHNEKQIKQVNEWDKIISNNQDQTKDNNSPNIILKNKIIKLETADLNLRSLAIEVEITLYMGGESCLWIFSRSLDKFTTDNAICFINKELESVRKFINFAIFEESDENLIVKTLKKQEIPKHDMVYNQSLDISEIKIRFIDNGDNKCFVHIDNYTNNKSFFYEADFFCPINNLTNIFVASTGDLISIKSMTIKQINRFLRDGNLNGVISKKMGQCSCCISF